MSTASLLNPLDRYPPSCGLTLLRAPRNTRDYWLEITSNDDFVVTVHCHRCVLLSHATELQVYLTGENFWNMSIKVDLGYVSAALELIQFMYLKDPKLITEKDKVLELCGHFGMSLDHFLIRHDHQLKPVNQYPTLRLVLTPDHTSEGRFSTDFLSFLKLEGLSLEKLTQNQTDTKVSPSPSPSQPVEPLSSTSPPSPPSQRSRKRFKKVTQNRRTYQLRSRSRPKKRRRRT